MELETQLALADIEGSQNIEPLLSEDDSRAIGEHVLQTYKVDKESRQKWEKKMEDATELALQITQEKSYPWKNASNVKFPLLTIASLQFASRAYPALVKAPDLVKFRVQGADPGGEKAAKAARISAHMSYQLLDEDEGWEEAQDRAFIALPILGCIFKKSYYDPVVGHNRSELVLPKDLVVHYYALSLETAERKTEVFQLSERSIKERVLSEIYSEKDLFNQPTPTPAASDERQGTKPPVGDKDAPRVVLEQHCFLDIDGDDYKEPYVVTIDEATKHVFRIVPRFKKVVSEQSLKIEEIQSRIQDVIQNIPQIEQPTAEDQTKIEKVAELITDLKDKQEALANEKPDILRIEPVEHYTKYSFIPAPDGGFYDLGFGSLLSPLNNSVNTLINQLIDSGSLQNGSVGFIGKGARIKGGKVRFSPNEWKRVDVAGATLRDALVPLPINQPSNVLFNLLSLLIDYSERIASVTEANTGQNVGQNTPAYNMNAMLEQGLQVFNGIFKRIYRSFRSELRKLYDLNGIYLDTTQYFEYQDVEGKSFQEDYLGDPKDLTPAADPNAFSNKEKQMKAAAIAERSQLVPGYDPIKVEQRVLEAMDIPDSAEIFPVIQNPETGELELKFQPGPDPQIELEMAELQRKLIDDKADNDRKFQLAMADITLKEIQGIKLLAEAEAKADEPELERLKLLVKELGDQRKAMIELQKVQTAKSRET